MVADSGSPRFARLGAFSSELVITHGRRAMIAFVNRSAPMRRGHGPRELVVERSLDYASARRNRQGARLVLLRADQAPHKCWRMEGLGR